MRSVYFLLPAALVAGGCASTAPLGPEESRNVAGKTFVVTGASSGFGRGVATALASHGANVVIAARRAAALEEVAGEARAAGGTPLVVTTDVGKPEDVERLARAAVERFGRIDVWINNAGVGAIGRFEDIPVQDHSRLIDVNLKGVLYGSHAALRQFRAQGHGTLVNVGSVESEVPMAYHASYAASKAAVLALGRALNEELRLNRLDNVAVATVMPWAADTPFWEHTANYSGGTPRMITMDDAQKAVNAIVRASLDPREEYPAGWKASGAYASHWVLPDVTERIAGNIAQRVQIESAPPAPATAGNLHAPVHAGTSVEGRARERMAREREEASTGATR
jgi:short-subunit dehydrogenase